MIKDLLGGLDTTEWATSTALPGWTVHDVVAHLIGTESRLAGDEEPPGSIDVTALAHARNAIGAANEQWGPSTPPRAPQAMLVRFHGVIRRRAEFVERIQSGRVRRPHAGTGRDSPVPPVHGDPSLRLLASRTGHSLGGGTI